MRTLRTSQSSRSKKTMKKFIATIILLSCFMVYADVITDVEALANSILQDRIAITPLVGVSANLAFEREFNAHVYQAALNTNDKKLKALVAMHALKDMPVIRRSGDKEPTEQERLRVLAENTQFKKLKKWYFQLLEGKRPANPMSREHVVAGRSPVLIGEDRFRMCFDPLIREQGVELVFRGAG